MERDIYNHLRLLDHDCALHVKELGLRLAHPRVGGGSGAAHDVELLDLNLVRRDGLGGKRVEDNVRLRSL